MIEYSLDQLTGIFRKLGAPDPEGWARSQIQEGIPQLARYLFLRRAWQSILPDDDSSWIDATIAETHRAPQAPFAGVGAALERVRTAGCSDADLTEIARGMQVALLAALCHQLEDPGPLEAEVQDVNWALVQVDDDGRVAAQVLGLHESVLETDPTGREMRPRGAV